MLKIIWYTFS